MHALSLIRFFSFLHTLNLLRRLACANHNLAMDLDAVVNATGPKLGRPSSSSEESLETSGLTLPKIFVNCAIK